MYPPTSNKSTYPQDSVSFVLVFMCIQILYCIISE